MSLDVSSDFPLAAHHIGWWALVTAERIILRDVAAKLRAFCEKVAVDPKLSLRVRGALGTRKPLESDRCHAARAMPP